MKILHLMKWLPFREDTGGKIRSAAIGRGLASFADVDAAGFVPPGEKGEDRAGRCGHYGRLFRIPPPSPPARLAGLCAGFASGLSLRSARFIDKTFVRTLREIVREGGYDAVQAEELPMRSAVLAAAPGLPAVYSAHNFESDLSPALMRIAGSLIGAGARIEERRTRKEERTAMERSLFCLAVSDKDRDALRRLAPESAVPIHVLPNCAPDRFAPGPEPGRETDILVVGAFGWRPNRDGLNWFLEAVLPLVRDARPGVSVRVAGSGLGPGRLRKLAERSVEAFPDVPDMLPHFRGSRMLAVPVRVGGGTRVKIMEAWAAGLPVASTSAGIDGLDCRPGHDVLVADDPGAFRDAVIRLLDDGVTSGDLRGAGLRNAAGRRWSDMTPVLERAYQEAFRGRRGRWD